MLLRDFSYFTVLCFDKNCNSQRKKLKKIAKNAKYSVEGKMNNENNTLKLIDYSHVIEESLLDTKPNSRERLLDNGAENLTTQELMMILLGSGTEKMPVRKLANKVLEMLDTCPRDALLNNLMTIEGIGKSKASLISALLEIGKRLNSGCGNSICKPHDIIPFIHYITLERQENFMCISLNGAHDILSVRKISLGTLNRCLIHPREVFSEALKERAAAIILAHNHPSGNNYPSQNDIEITQQLYDVSKIVGIHLLDHIIVCSNDYFSFAENSIIFT